ncbi:SDR family NAD(P)-dependent oxidoreductase [Xenorhabdus bovienii]|uniref:SDR family NAD(P)-dependent oxidoreductase n=1 Tax=Xenorhabdus bovienii TaxID=40576 RepID=UPI0023B265B2|nr:SDR family NAD(P)-dependent oxidoreductase [Xenorhabdus bovienii]MDE9556290.1 SDR family NAD(P)-dependent oxidoreductase [Xenorhabdus bovienii]
MHTSSGLHIAAVNESSVAPRQQDIAVMGIACRFPGAKDYQAFWRLLEQRMSAVEEIPPSRWDWQRFWGDPDREINKSNTRWGGFIADVDAFDFRFFGLSPAVVAAMDPQQRLMLELTWHALEDAAISPAALRGRMVGTFFSAFNYDYKELQEQEIRRIEASHATGTASAIIANRVSHLFDFHGPSLTVDSSCSGSLSAVHLAIQSLRSGECEMALAGGINLLLTPTRHISFAQSGMMSPTGSCKPFDSLADGYVRGEGAGVLLLKPLTQALKDGDLIHGVLKGSAINHTGKTHTLTYPSADAQAQVIERAMRDAGVQPQDITCIEAHGTGTPKGDPIEMAGIVTALGQDTTATPCMIGSVKANIGHLEAAAGIAGIIKVLLQMKHRCVAGLANLQQLNPALAFDQKRFRLSAENQAWDDDKPRIAGVSAFGFGGTNGHIIIAEAPAAVPPRLTFPAALPMVLSAKSHSSLNAYRQQLLAWLRSLSDEEAQKLDLAALSYTLLTCRESFNYRQGWVVSSLAELQQHLAEAGEGQKVSEADVQQLSPTDELPKRVAAWCRGGTLSWQSITTAQPARMRLPGYVFDDTRIWLTPAGIDTAVTWCQLENLRFGERPLVSVALDSHSPWFVQHEIHQRPLLAAASLIELLLQAAHRVLPHAENITLQRLQLQQPVTPAKTSRVCYLHFAQLSVADNQSWQVMLTDTAEENTAHKGIFCQAELHGSAVAEEIACFKPPVEAATLTGAALYEHFARRGFVYGPLFRGIEQLWRERERSCARLILTGDNMQDSYAFNPALLDAAFQVALDRVLQSSQDNPIVSAMGQLTIFAKPHGGVWVEVVEEQALCFSLYLYHAEGAPCACLKGLQFTLLASGNTNASGSLPELSQLSWEPLAELASAAPAAGAEPLILTHCHSASETEAGDAAIVLKGTETSDELWQRIQPALQGSGHIIWLAPQCPIEDEQQKAPVLALFRLCKALLRAPVADASLRLSIVGWQGAAFSADASIFPASAALYGLAETVAKENPHWRVEIFDLPENGKLVALPEPGENGTLSGTTIALREGHWWQRVHLPLVDIKPDFQKVMPVTSCDYRHGGVYVLIGGAGGIGIAWSEQLIRQFDAQIVWIGRRICDAHIRAALTRLSEFGHAPVYIQADAADAEQLSGAYRLIKMRFGDINGVFQMAMSFRHLPLALAEEGDFTGLLRSKIDVSLTLSRVFCRESLDFILLFSSVNSFVAAAGQGHYAAGCRFQDALSGCRFADEATRVLTINWGYWTDVGALVQEQGLQRWREMEGIGNITLSQAFTLARYALRSGQTQLTVYPVRKARALLPSTRLHERLRHLPSSNTPPTLLPILPRPAEASGGLNLDEADALCIDLLWLQLRVADLFTLPEGKLAMLAACSGGGGFYARWLQHSARWLERYGYLTLDGAGGYRLGASARKSEPAAQLWSRWDVLCVARQRVAGQEAQMKLLDTLLRALPQILRGEVPATDIMFPGSSMTLVEGIYCNNPVADYFNQALAAGVVAALGNTRGAKVLEIGAGTGGSSAQILAQLHAEQVEMAEYCYTDLSRAFLLHGEAQFSVASPWLRCRQLDISQNVEAQGYEAGSYDVVLATNVLHATRNIRETLRNAKALLKAGGTLLINELSEPTLFSHLTFGLLEGWWLYEDEELRLPGSPGLSAEQWGRVLKQEGFSEVVWLSEGAELLGQQVIGCRSDGVIRQMTTEWKAPVRAEQAQMQIPPTAPHAEPQSSMVIADTAALQQVLRDLIAEALRYAPEDIDASEAFADYGVDSITGVGLVRRINEQFALPLSTTVLFACPSLEKLTAHIAHHYPTCLAATASTIADNHSASDVAASPQIEEIAIIGISGRFARADSLDELWQALREKQSLIEPVSRWDLSSAYPAGESYCAHGGFLQGHDEFDPQFFNISAKEATWMDPQQRLFLQEAWRCLEDSGYAQGLEGRDVGVYVGLGEGDYQKLFADAIPPAQAFWGNSASVVPARIAYYLDLKGPAIAVNTACSSSLVAIHLACQSLRQGECEVALAGGVFVQSTAVFYHKANRAQMLSPSGKCHTFDQSADGFVPSEGVGAILLKPLALAQQAGDHIYGVISASGINQDGASNGITAPNLEAQRQLVEKVYDQYGIDVTQVGLMEAHGTGTVLGDPIEFQAITQAFSKGTSQRNYCAIGSVKSTLGHAAEAAGLAGLAKILLAFRYQQLPPSLNFQQGNSDIDFANTPFYVNTELRDWPAPPQGCRMAAISGFGFSGTNAHLVLAEAPACPERQPRSGPWLAMLSAKTSYQLRARAQQMLDYCRQQPQQDPGDVCYSLLVGRKHFSQRLALAVESLAQLEQQLVAWLDRGTVPSLPDAFTFMAESWLQGGTLSAEKLFVGDYRRTPLPHYPFARERYWLPQLADEQPRRQSWQLTPEQPLLTQHRIDGVPVLSATAQVALICEGIRSENAQPLALQGITLEQLVWSRPVVVSRPLTLTLNLQRGAESYRFTLTAQDADGMYQCCEGEAKLTPATSETIELAQMQQAFQVEVPNLADFYENFSSAGIVYGTSYRGLNRLWQREGELLAQIDALPFNNSDNQPHPGALDSALQAAAALWHGILDSEHRYVPFSFDSIKIYRLLPRRIYAHITRAGRQHGSAMQQVNVSCYNEKGELLLLLEGAWFRPLPQGSKTLIARPFWQQVNLSSFQSQSAPKTARVVRYIVNAAVPALGSDETFSCAEVPLSAAAFSRLATEFMQALQRLLRESRQQPLTLQLIIRAKDEMLTALYGALATVSEEYPQLVVQMISVAQSSSADNGRILQRCASLAENGFWRLENEQLWRRSWHEVAQTQTLPLPLQSAGCYLISGGLGGIGREIMQALIARCPNSDLVIVGRSPCPNGWQQSLIGSSTAFQGTLSYHALDVSDKAAVEELIAQLEQRGKAPLGLIHCAGINQDSYLINKTISQLTAVFAAKVMGIEALDDATKHLPLDFMLFCSSISALFGHDGQADYAMANGWLDAFARRREQQVARGERSGRTLSVNWPLWQGLGMSMTSQAQQQLYRRMGLRPMPQAEGLHVLLSRLAAAPTQTLVMYGDATRIRQFLKLSSEVNHYPAGYVVSVGGDELIDKEIRMETPASTANTINRAELIDALKNLLAETTGLVDNRIHSTMHFEEFGIDSLMVMEMTRTLEKQYGRLPKTLFFEYQTLEQLTEYFSTQHAETVRVLYPRTIPAVEPEAAVSVPLAESASKQATGQPTPEGRPEAIAIIGLAGRYPQAENMQQFWHNLASSRDCVTPVPIDRWQHDDYYSAEGEAGKANSRWGGFLHDVQAFDPLLFNIAPREAELMDPQERLFLQCAWQAIEDAGYTRDPHQQAAAYRMSDRVGVFAGVMYHEYQLYGAEQTQRGEPLALSGSAATIANRVSFCFDFSGPSLAIDSMCSSSLTALHLACQSLRSGECELALAGGVNLSLHPNKYLWLGQGKFSSPTGRCESFGKGGQGYVPAEGVGVALLKPLSAALRDGDHIYGLIKGSSINHGGKTNGYTVPAPHAQAQVVRQALAEAALPASALSYVEAHGTGTTLGDPIEINGLEKAFSQAGYGNKTCAIGSVKSNIGHAESAAGMAGLSKILLQLQHGKLAPSLHADELNPNIDWQNSLFRVQRTLAEWPQETEEVNGELRVLPRRAGLSSFGAGGGNAHLVIEEFIPSAPSAAPAFSDRPQLVVLSARNETRLAEMAQHLAQALMTETAATLSLANVAFTLQTGRQHFSVRLAAVAHSCAQLAQQLAAFGSGEREIDGLSWGDSRQSLQTEPLLDEQDCQALAESWLAQERLDKLAPLWCAGHNIDLTARYQQMATRRISLPGYVFSRDRYWFSTAAWQPSRPSGGRSPLAPLLHENVSTLNRTAFQSTFYAHDFFLRDHQVQGRSMLPGVVSLEMAAAACRYALPEKITSCLSIQHVSWLRPVVLAEKDRVEVELTLHPAAGEGVRFILQTPAEDVAEPKFFCQGEARYLPAEPLVFYDIAALQTQCPNALNVETFYRSFDELGIHYGAAHRGVRALWRGEDKALAQIALPDCVQQDWQTYLLHPSLLDAALQTVQCLLDVSSTQVPFAIDKLCHYAPIQAQMWVSVTRAAQSQSERSFDLSLIDQSGQICVALMGLSVRPLQPEGARHTVPETVSGYGENSPSDVGHVALAPVWRRQQLDVAQPVGSTWVLGAYRQQQQQLQSNGWRFIDSPDALPSAGDEQHDIRIILLASHNDPLLQSDLLLALNSVQTLIKRGWQHKALWFDLITFSEQSGQAGLHGFAGSLSKENAKWSIRVAELPDSQRLDTSLNELAMLPASGDSYRWRDGIWLTQALAAVTLPQTESSLWRRGGIYLIIGGASGIGAAWSENLIVDYQAQVIWLGRRPIDALIQQRIDALSSNGPAPRYLQADAADAVQLEAVKAKVISEYGGLHGVIHSAIVLHDQSLASIAPEDFSRVLRAKTHTAVQMTRVFGDLPLDFMLFFSSLISFSRTPGQANYAAGSNFLDAWAAEQNRRFSFPVKVVNWGFWGDIGIVAQQTYQQRMKKLGIGSIEFAAAWRCIAALLTSNLQQLVFIHTLKSGVIPLFTREELLRLAVQQAALSPLPMAISADSGVHVSVLDKEVNQLCAALLWCQLLTLPLFDDRLGNLAHQQQRLPQNGVARRWLQHSAGWLARYGYLTLDDEGGYRLSTREAEPAAQLWSRWDALCRARQSVAGQEAQLKLLDTLLRALPQILRGEVPATDIMFPSSSMTLVEGIYRNNPVADYFNQALAAGVAAALGNTRGAKVLEIGAGTGSSSAQVLAQLHAEQVEMAEYCYTDLSRAFLLHGEAQFGATLPWLRCRKLDISQSVEAQGYEAGSYDVVLATNVLHATRNIRETLRNAKALLKAGGTLLINELSEPTLFSHLTFGLLEGWWLYEDEELRLPGSPGLSAEQWGRVLKQEGFSEVVWLSEGAELLGQQVIGCRSDGVIRQVTTEWKAPVRAAQAQTQVPPTVAMVIEAKKEGVIMGQQAVQVAIRRALSSALKVQHSDMNNDEPFADYGLDSISAVAVVQSLNDALSIKMETTTLFEYSTIDTLTTHILAAHRLQIVSAVETPQEAIASVAAPEVEGLTVPSPDPEPASEPLVSSEASQRDEPIAIIGMSGIFPNSDNLEGLWQHLANGDNLVTPVTRWPLAQIYQQAGLSGIGCNKGALLDDIAGFDAAFFNISGLEASHMDPQQRLFLMEAWRTLENAGYAGSGVSGKQIGVYVGCSTNDYRSLFREESPAQAFWGNAASVIPARVSYYLNLQGPALAVDTACSSALVAIHLACQSLWRGECEMALAGGVFIQPTPAFYLAAQKAGMLSADGHCHTFDQRANGFVPGEGCGAVLLKSLRQAEADGDHIQAVIRACGSNQDGTSNGITAPNAQAQHRLQRETWRRFGINPEEIELMEAHGTGTKLGDPIEFNALNRSFGELTARQHYCAIGSVKTNLGHTITAAGITGLFKLVLALRYQQIPPSLHFNQGNEHINFHDSPFYVNTQLKPWPARAGHKRKAAINAFGFSGTNVHLVVEEAPPARVQVTNDAARLVVLSARSLSQLQQQASRLLQVMQAEQRDNLTLRDVSFTLLDGRKHFNWRLACVAHTLDELSLQLSEWLRLQTSGVRVWFGEVDTQNSAVLEQSPELTLMRPITLENLAMMAVGYCQGSVLSWQQVSENEPARRLPLPVYPFDKQRYWPEVAQLAEANSASAAPEHTTQMWCYFAEQWQQQPLIATQQWDEKLRARQHQTLWVVYHHKAQRDTLEELMSAIWSQSGQSLPERHYVAADQLVRQIDTLPAPDSVFFLAVQQQEDDDFTELQSLFCLSQGLMRLCWQRPIRAYYLYNAPEAHTRWASEALSGLFHSVQQEAPAHIWRMIGLYNSALTPAQHLLQEWLNDDETQETVAVIRYLGQQRQQRVHVELPAPESRQPLFKRGGNYLIVGGNGPVGRQLCARLCQQYQAKIAVISRSASDEESGLSDLAVGGEGEVVLFPADITNEQQLRRAWSAIKQRFGHINGVIHMARQVSDALLINKSWADFSAVIAAKTTGTAALDKVTGDEPLDFFMLFSSLAAYGIKGSADYGYSAAWQQNFALWREAQRRKGRRQGRSLSLAWGAWSVDRYQPKNRAEYLQQQGFDCIYIDRALHEMSLLNSDGVSPAFALMAVLDQDKIRSRYQLVNEAGLKSEHQLSAQPKSEPSHSCATEDKNQMLDRLAREGLDNLSEQQLDGLYRYLINDGEDSEIASNNTDVGVDVASSMDLEEVISNTLSAVLHIPAVSRHEPFIHYGMDSVGAMQVATRLSQVLNVNFSSGWLVEYSSLDKLVSYLKKSGKIK